MLEKLGHRPQEAALRAGCCSCQSHADHNLESKVGTLQVLLANNWYHHSCVLRSTLGPVKDQCRSKDKLGQEQSQQTRGALKTLDVLLQSSTVNAAEQIMESSALCSIHGESVTHRSLAASQRPFLPFC